MNDLITLNISALEMKPGDPNTLYAGTGEGLMYFDNLPGRGILKTSDGGNTWKRAHIAQGLNSPFITAIAVSPANPNVVYAAGRKAYLPNGWPAETVPDAGIDAIFKSNDSGETWQDVTTGKGIEHDPSLRADNIPADVVVSPTDANVVYATFGLNYWGGIWKSINGGQTWFRLTNGLPNPSLANMGYGRIKLAMAPSNPNILYASFAYNAKPGDTVNLKDDAMLGLWKSTNSGQNWTQMTTPLTSSQLNRNNGATTALGSQGGYANALIVHPTDPNIVFVGGLDIYKTTDGGNSWSQVSMWLPPSHSGNPEGIPYVHADHHVFAFDRSTNPPTLYNGSDGGVARSRDLGKTWDILNYDLGVTQFYTFAVHPTNPNIMLGGTQDNGTPMLRSRQANSWSEVIGADGWQTYFDYTDPARIYVSTQQLGMARVIMNYATGKLDDIALIGYFNGANGITQSDVDKAAFLVPYELSPNNPNVLILGTNRLLKSTNRGDSWTALSTEVDSALIAVAIAEGNDNIMWFATTRQIFKTEDNGATYANVTGANLPKRFLTDIEFDPSNNRNVYVTYSGYGTPHVFKSANAGGSWTNISNNLPDTPANTIQVHPQKPNTLFLGTDIGVFLSENGGQTWQPCTNGLPTVQVTAIALNIKANRVYAGTHGRGAYSAELPNSSTAVLSVSASEIQIQTKPGQTGEASFAISNTGGAALSFNIATSGGQAHASIRSANGELASLPISNVPLETVLPAPSKNMSFRRKPFQSEHIAGIKKDPYRMTEKGKVLAQPAELQGNDVLVLDDGNNAADDFIGEGPNSANEFYWMNQFDLAQDFLLEAMQVYMRTETQTSNTVEVAIMDNNLDDLLRTNVNLTLAQNGGWFTIKFTNPLRFKTGDTFYLELGANAAIAYPAGADKNAQTPNRSFHYNWVSGDYEALGAVAGFERGAYLIRALGTKSGGSTNQPPVAKTQFSKTLAKVNEAITFDASQSFDPDGQITQYLWDFGDNTSSNQKVATHAYARTGNFSPKLTVTDDKGATGQAIGFITISPGGTNRLAANPLSGTVAPGGAQTIKVTFDTQGLAEGNYQGQISITSNGGNKTIPVRISVSNSSTSTVELLYDNGASTEIYSWAKAGQGSAVRFTPPLRAKVKAAKIFIGSIQNGNKHKLRVLADANGRPGNTIHGPIEFTVPGTGWATYDLSAANLTVSGDFYVMIEYDGASEPKFGSENTAPLEKRSWGFDGQKWALYDAEDYLIRAVVEIGTTGVDDRKDGNGAPKIFALAQNYPNPFWSEATSRFAGNPETSIRYTLPHDGEVTLAVFDLTGRRVALLESGVQTAGEHTVRWNGRNGAGNRVTSGVYFYRLEATSPAGTVTILKKKMTVLK